LVCEKSTNASSSQQRIATIDSGDSGHIEGVRILFYRFRVPLVSNHLKT
jgi:hypothetical protein